MRMQLYSMISYIRMEITTVRRKYGALSASSAKSGWVRL
jgi:hypothetical protein